MKDIIIEFLIGLPVILIGFIMGYFVPWEVIFLIPASLFFTWGIGALIRDLSK